MRPGAPPVATADGGNALHLQAPAKLNLWLRVLAREAGGFHQLETLFCAVELADELEVETGCDAGIRLHVGPPPDRPGPPPDLGPPERNLAVRAATLFFRAAALPPRAELRLTKRIPAGAGLGGGSSDAAAVLHALNSLHGSPLQPQQLLELAGTLGSDVPFFLAGARLALAWGRGTRMLPLPPLPSRPVLLAVPQAPVNTAAAYAALAASRGEGWSAPPLLLRVPRDWDHVAATAVNDFEDVVFRRFPGLAAVRAALADAGAVIARMTGSGSVLFGVFDDVASAEGAQAALATSHPDVQWVLTRC
jgi:4-diphosphocytidyl-2-C-methyl-D-erythritol kinase